MRRELGTLDDALDLKSNSLNFLRLVLATTVLVSHAIVIGSFGQEAFLHGTSLGTVAVYAFFGISGYLIAGSAVRNRAGRYLWQRFLRIVPGFWVCLAMTAFGFALVGWLGHHSSLSGYEGGPNSPFGFVWRNSLLRMVQPLIKSSVWNGSLWTLFYEALCYVILVVLAIVGALRHRLVALLLGGAVWLANALITFTPGQENDFNVFHAWVWMNLLKFTAIFMVGAVLYLYRDRVPDSGWLALGCTALFSASLWLPGFAPAYYFRPSCLGAPLVAYPMLWLGAHLPFRRVGAKNDYSYGVYIYAYPVTMLLAVWGVPRWGYVPFALLSVLATAPFAAASWWLVEKRVLSLKRVDWRVIRRPRRISPESG